MALLFLLHQVFPAAFLPPAFLLAANPGALIAGLVVIGTIAWALSRPREALRLLAGAIVHGLYRIDRRALADIPERGAAVLAPNHVSFIDAVLIVALSPRPVRFVMDSGIYATPLLNPLFRAVGAIPIAPARADRRLLARARDRIAEALDAGELVCIFPEGAITRDGGLAPFRSGIEHIVRRSPVPVVPIGLHGLWGSVFSHAERRPVRRSCGLPRRALRIASAPPLPPEQVSADRLRSIVAGLIEPPQAPER